MTPRTRHGCGLWVGALLSALLVQGGPADRPAFAQDGEPVPIAELREYPERYHLHQVIVQGTAQDVRAFDPYKLPSGSVCYGAYSFRLADETGALPIIVMGICGVPAVKDPDVNDGDILTSDITVHAPGKGTFFLTLDGRRMAFTDIDDVQGVALNIRTVTKADVAAPEAPEADALPAQPDR